MPADPSELSGFTDPPPEASVRLDITAHIRPLEIVDRAEADIELDIGAKVHLRTREKPKIGIVPCRFAIGEVDMPLLDLEILRHGRQAEIQPPPGRDLLLRPGLDAVGVTLEAVGEPDRDRKSVV